VSIETCDWHGDFDPCRVRVAYLVEWDEDGMEFGSFLCDRHTAAIRAGISPFEEYGTHPVITRIRTAESVLASPISTHERGR
jgi:hypothetical protein